MAFFQMVIHDGVKALVGARVVLDWHGSKMTFCESSLLARQIGLPIPPACGGSGGFYIHLRGESWASACKECMSKLFRGDFDLIEATAKAADRILDDEEVVSPEGVRECDGRYCTSRAQVEFPAGDTGGVARKCLDCFIREDLIRKNIPEINALLRPWPEYFPYVPPPRVDTTPHYREPRKSMWSEMSAALLGELEMHLPAVYALRAEMQKPLPDVDLCEQLGEEIKAAITNIKLIGG